MTKLIKLVLIPAILVIAGCDSSALLANIDTYTCAYLPSVIDCTTQEVHDKAVAMLQHGIVAARVDCIVEDTGTIDPANGLFSNQSHKLFFNAKQFLDGSSFVQCSGGAPPLAIAGGTELHERGETLSVSNRIYDGTTFQGFNVCEAVDGQLQWKSTISYHFGNPPGTTITNPVYYQFDIPTYCTGFNFAAFGVEE